MQITSLPRKEFGIKKWIRVFRLSRENNRKAFCGVKHNETFVKVDTKVRDDGPALPPVGFLSTVLKTQTKIDNRKHLLEQSNDRNFVISHITSAPVQTV